MITRPTDFLAWAVEVFGPVARDRKERATRFIEEAVELVQAEGMPAHTLERIITRVYSRAPGDVRKELGQAQVTLELFAESAGLSADVEAAFEFDRVRAIPKEEWVKRHNDKVAIGIAST